MLSWNAFCRRDLRRGGLIQDRCGWIKVVWNVELSRNSFQVYVKAAPPLYKSENRIFCCEEPDRVGTNTSHSWLCRIFFGGHPTNLIERWHSASLCSYGVRGHSSYGFHRTLTKSSLRITKLYHPYHFEKTCTSTHKIFSLCKLYHENSLDFQAVILFQRLYIIRRRAQLKTGHRLNVVCA